MRPIRTCRALRALRALALGLLWCAWGASALAQTKPISVNPAVSNYWPQSQTMSLCPISGIAPTPSALLCSGWDLTLSGNTTIGFPTNMPSGQPGGGLSVVHKWLRVHQPASGGPFGYRLATGTGWSTSGLGIQPPLSTTPGATDYLECTGILSASAPPTLECPTNNAGLNGVLPTANLILRVNHSVNSAGCNAAPCVVQVSVTGSTGGDFRVVKATACANGSCTPAASALPTSITDGTTACTLGANAFYDSAGATTQSSVWGCKGITAGNHILTVTWAQQVWFANIFFEEWGVPAWFQGADANLGNSNFNATGSTTLGVSTNGAVTVNGELVSVICNGGGGVNAALSPTVLVDSVTNNVSGYISPFTQTVQSPTFTQPTSAQWECSVGAWQ